jgi:hypothetical protein
MVGSNGFDTVTFATDAIQTGRNGGTTVEGGGGVTGKLTRNISVYGDASFWVRSVASNASPSKASLVCVRRGVLAVNKRPTEASNSLSSRRAGNWPSQAGNETGSDRQSWP